MKENLVSRIIEIKTNSLDAYISKYFETHLEEKKNVLEVFKKYRCILKIEPCMWALIVALDGMYFDELIIDDYTHYEVVKDLRFIIASDELSRFLSKECIIRIGLSKEWKYIYQFGKYTILKTILFTDGERVDDIVNFFKRIVETQMYYGKPLLENINLTYINEEMKLLECIFKVRHKLNYPATLVFYALHHLCFADAMLKNENLDSLLLEQDIDTILKDKKVKAQYMKVPGLFLYIIKDLDEKVFDSNFSCDEILTLIKNRTYFSCTTRVFEALISYVYKKYPNRFDEFENILLDYIEKDEFCIEYCSIFYLIYLERGLRHFKEYDAFKEAVLGLPVMIGLFKEFKTRKSNLVAGLKIVVRKYNIEFDYIVNLVSQVIDDEDEDEIAEFESFKNILK